MNDGIVSGLVFAACLVLVSLAWGFAAWLYLERKQREYEARIREALTNALTSPDENTPSPFAQIADTVCILLAARLVQQLKTMLAGTSSGVAKADSEAQQAALFDVGPSWLPLVAGILPKKLRASIAKNPQFLTALAGLGKRNGQEGEEAPSVLNRLRRKEQ